MKPFSTLLSLFLLCSLASFAQKPKDAAKPAAANPAGNIKKYHVLFYYRSATPLKDTAQLKKLQREHLAYTEAKYHEGLVGIAGPFGGKEDLRGMLILQTDDAAIADALGAGDPLVRAGHFRYEIKPWYSEPGHAMK